MRVRFTKIIQGGFGASGADVWLYRDIDLPFAPFPGLFVTDGDWEVTVTEVCYRINKVLVECWTEKDDRIYQALLHQREPQDKDKIVEEYLGSGWLKDGP